MTKRETVSTALAAFVIGVFFFAVQSTVQYLRAQTTTPIYSTPPATLPVCSASWDIPNKLLVTTCTVNGAVFPPISYNPRLLEGNNAGGFTISLGGITIIYQHNLASDALKYNVGTTTVVLAAGSSPVPF
jgi:hypothetical protein